MLRLRALPAVLLLAACASNGLQGPGNEGGGGGGLDHVGGQQNLGGTGGASGDPPDQGFLPDASNAQSGGDSVVCGVDYPPASTFFLSPDDSGSMASPRYARELLRAGALPAPARVRPHEFMNYYHFDFPEPDDRLGVHGELRKLDGSADAYELLVAVRARSAPRPPMGVTFVVDSSASMAGPGIARARRALTSMIGQLAEGDVVSVVRWSSDAEPLVEGQTIHEATKQELAQQVVELIAPYGGSDLTGGLQKGYQLAHEHAVVGQNTVVLLSDGGASPSPYDLAEVQKEIAAADENDRVHLTGVGVGPAAGYDDALMDAITDAARGSYAYVDDDGLADAVVGERFDELMFVAEEAIGVSVALPGYLEIQSFSGEEVSTQKELVRDQHIAPGDTVVLRQVLRLRAGCDASVIGSNAYATSIVATASSGVGDAYVEIADVDIPLAGGGAPSFNLTKARLVHRFASALAVTDGESAVKAALNGVLSDFAAAKLVFPSLDDELVDIEETITLFLAAA